MKKFILLLTFLFSLSSVFVGCKGASQEEGEFVNSDSGINEFETQEQVTTGFSEYDENDDGLWDEKEFGVANNNDKNFSEWDNDGDEAFNSDEFYNSKFQTADHNSDEGLDEEEWNQGYLNAFGDYALEKDFSIYDQNRDGLLDNDEWNTGLGNSDWFNYYDTNDNQLIENNEWNRGHFSEWDKDGSGFLEEEEYDNYNKYNAGMNR